jgi:hypothetical protein
VPEPDSYTAASLWVRQIPQPALHQLQTSIG